MGGNAAVARVLVEHGADVNRRDSEGKTVMMVRWCLLEVSLTPAVLSSHVSNCTTACSSQCVYNTCTHSHGIRRPPKPSKEENS